jgi:hypothetical protein
MEAKIQLIILSSKQGSAKGIKLDKIHLPEKECDRNEIGKLMYNMCKKLSIIDKKLNYHNNQVNIKYIIGKSRSIQARGKVHMWKFHDLKSTFKIFLNTSILT